MGLLLVALALLFVGSGAVIAAIVHRRKELAKRDEDLAKRAAYEAVKLSVSVIRGETPLPR